MRLRGALVFAIISWSATAGATYSVTALDRETKALGGAGASCVPYRVDVIWGAVAGKGALNAQAALDEDAKDDAVALLAQGLGANAVLSRMNEEGVYPARDRMQWGIVDVSGGSARFTGPEAQAFASDLNAESRDGRFVGSVQGNLLTSIRVLEQSRDAFANESCDLAEHLMRSLEAASLGGEGDARCTPEGRPANSAYLDVTFADGTNVHLGVADVSPSNPIAALRFEYDRFRVENPCEPKLDTEPRAGKSEACAMGSPPSASRTPVAWLALSLIALGCGIRRRRSACVWMSQPSSD
jgi:MYXO-CTERM domain-containing protein